MGKTNKDSFMGREKKLHKNTKGKTKLKVQTLHNVTADELINSMSQWDDEDFNYKGNEN